MTRFQLHVQNWGTCTRCALAAGRTTVVLARGVIPCDICFVGEAPGVSEDALGKPFCGPAGRLLDRLIARGLGGGYRLLFTNLLACIPLEDGPATPEGVGLRGAAKVTEPPEESVRACKPRLEELLEIAAPRLVVAVGAVARAWLVAKGECHAVRLPLLPSRPAAASVPGGPVANPVQTGRTPAVSVLHPAAILRANVAQRGLLEKQVEVTLRAAAREHLGGV